MGLDSCSGSAGRALRCNDLAERASAGRGGARRPGPPPQAAAVGERHLAPLDVTSARKYTPLPRTGHGSCSQPAYLLPRTSRERVTPSCRPSCPVFLRVAQVLGVTAPRPHAGSPTTRGCAGPLPAAELRPPPAAPRACSQVCAMRLPAASRWPVSAGPAVETARCVREALSLRLGPPERPGPLPASPPRGASRPPRFTF